MPEYAEIEAFRRGRGAPRRQKCRLPGEERFHLDLCLQSFVFSVFWAYMVDMFTVNKESGCSALSELPQRRRLWGTITASAVKSVGVPSLLIFAAVLMKWEYLLHGVSAGWRPGDQTWNSQHPDDRPIGGSVIAGFTHALHDPTSANQPVYALYTVLSTFLYFKQVPSSIEVSQIVRPGPPFSHGVRGPRLWLPGPDLGRPPSGGLPCRWLSHGLATHGGWDANRKGRPKQWLTQHPADL